MNKNQNITTNRVGGGSIKDKTKNNALCARAKRDAPDSQPFRRLRDTTKNQGGHSLYNDKDTLTLIKAALKEDIGPGDITTEATLKKDKTIKATITSNQNGILCGIDIAKKVFETLDKNITFKKQANDSEKIKANQTIAKLKGSAKTILAGERTALNFLGHLTGIATQTSKYVEQCQNAELLDTRKTTPCLRTLEKYAVRCGGGKNHRIGLYDMILIKDNHIKAAGSIENALALANKQNIISIREGSGSRTMRLSKTTSDPKRHSDNTCVRLSEAKRTNDQPFTRLSLSLSEGCCPAFNKAVELECKTLDEVKEALKATTPPDIIMLDNMTIPQIKKALNLTNKKTKTEISGGITLNNIKQIDALRPDYISTSKITVSAPHHDYSMNIEI